MSISVGDFFSGASHSLFSLYNLHPVDERRMKLFTRWQKEGIALDSEQLQTGDFGNYLEELVSGKMQSRTASQLEALAPLLGRLSDRLIQARPSLIELFDPVWGAGKTWHGYLERHWLSKPFPGLAALTPKQRHYAEDERLFSALADREPPLQTLVWMDRQPQVWSVAFAQERAGAWIGVYTPLDPSYAGQALIACRGTAPRLHASGGAMSMVNDLLPELGSCGLQSSWPELLAWLQVSSIGKVEVGGKSLGGTIAQMLLPLLENSGIRVKRLITFQSPGVCEGVHRAALQSHVAASSHKLEVSDYVYGSMKKYGADYVVEAGGDHLAYSLIALSSVKARRLYVADQLEIEPVAAFHTHVTYNLAKLVTSVPAHGLRLGLHPHKSFFKELEFWPHPPAKASLIEKIRRAIFWILVALTGGLFLLFRPKKSMYEYIHEQAGTQKAAFISSAASVALSPLPSSVLP